MSTVFEENANTYDEWFVENNHLYDSEVSAVASVMDEGRTYVEVGVGTGLFATRLGIESGVEPCKEMADIAIRRGIAVENGVAEHLPYKDKSVDGIVMITVDCFVSDIMQVFREAYRVLSPGGSYVMAFLDRETPLGQCYEASKAENEYYRDATFRSASEMREYLRSAGFAVVETKQTVFTLDNISQPVKDGNGDGVFAIIKATKEI